MCVRRERQEVVEMRHLVGGCYLNDVISMELCGRIAWGHAYS